MGWFGSLFGIGKKPVPPPAPAPVPSPKPPQAPGWFVRVQGQTFVRPDGSEFRIAGLSQGTWGTWQDSDVLRVFTWGANAMRLPLRWWGLYGDVTIDCRDDSQPFCVSQGHWEEYHRQVGVADAQNLPIWATIDSNSGQSSIQGETPEEQQRSLDYAMKAPFDKQFPKETFHLATGGRNFVTDPSQAELFANIWVQMVRRFKADKRKNVVGYEIAPEMLAGFPDSFVPGLLSFYRMVAQRIREEDPITPIFVGGRGYNPNDLRSVLITDVTGIAYTYDAFYQGDLSNWKRKVSAAVDFGQKYNVPVVGNQIGVKSSRDDAKNTVLRSMIDFLLPMRAMGLQWQLRQNTNDPGEYAILLDPVMQRGVQVSDEVEKTSMLGEWKRYWASGTKLQRNQP